MKFFPLLLAVTLTAHAAPGDPGKVAVDFLEKVRHRKLDLEPGGDTALSPHTVEGKRRQIAKQLERMARDLGTDPLEVGEVRTDENFAAVLVRKIGGFDPGRLQVFPVALVKQKGGEWSAAPLPASFENAGAGYAVALRQRLAALENWMLHEQVVDLEKLREQSAGRMRRNIETSLSAETLRGYQPQQVGEQFLAACSRRDLPAVLGFLGGLAAEFPADWTQRLKAADRAISAGNNAKRPWRLLLSPAVAKVLVHHEEEQDSGLISYACLDPVAGGNDGPRIEMVHLELTKSSNGLWQIDPPAGFLEEDSEPADDGESDSDLIEEFPGKWVETHPLAPQPTAELAHQELIRSMHGGDLGSFLKISALAGDPGRAVTACNQAAAVWGILHNPSAVRYAVPLSFQETGTAAAAIFQFFSSRDPDLLDLRTFYFEKTDAGWLWSPEATADLKEWVAAEARRWPGKWQEKLLGEVPVIADFANLQAPGEEQARGCVEKWLEAARQGNVQGAVSLFARLGDPASSAKAFQNLGYEISGAKIWDGAPVITGLYRGKFWTAVGVKIAQQGGKIIRPLFPVILTSEGPRILAEVDLFSPENRGRDYLNAESIKLLRKSSSDAVADELKTFLEEFKTSVAKKAEPGGR